MVKSNEMVRLEGDLRGNEELQAKPMDAAKRIAEAGEATSGGDATKKPVMAQDNISKFEELLGADGAMQVRLQEARGRL